MVLQIFECLFILPLGAPSVCLYNETITRNEEKTLPVSESSVLQVRNHSCLRPMALLELETSNSFWANKCLGYVYMYLYPCSFCQSVLSKQYASAPSSGLPSSMLIRKNVFSSSCATVLHFQFVLCWELPFIRYQGCRSGKDWIFTGPPNEFFKAAKYPLHKISKRGEMY